MLCEKYTFDYTKPIHNLIFFHQFITSFLLHISYFNKKLIIYLTNIVIFINKYLIFYIFTINTYCLT